MKIILLTTLVYEKGGMLLVIYENYVHTLVSQPIEKRTSLIIASLSTLFSWFCVNQN